MLLLIAQDELSEAGTALASCDEYVTVPAEEGRFQKSVAGLLERARMDSELARASHSPRSGGGEGASFLETGQIRPFQQYERDILLHALNTTNWNVKETATRLKIGRATLYRKIDRYNLRAFRHQRQAS
ncbi:MAG: helix-turn-helix domain-containing protein [Planctomycetota bacterium]